MKFYKEGQKSQGICKECKKLVKTTFKLSTVPLSSGKGKVDGILAARCDECDHVVGIPHQSVPRIQETIKKKQNPIEARVPSHLEDILVNAARALIGEQSDTTIPTILKFYINMVYKNKTYYKKIAELADSDFAKGKSNKRVSLKVNDNMKSHFKELLDNSGLTQKKAIVGLILKINEDVFQRPKKTVMQELQKVLEATA